MSRREKGEEASKEASKQASKEARKQASKQASKQVSKRKGKVAREQGSKPKSPVTLRGFFVGFAF